MAARSSPPPRRPAEADWSGARPRRNALRKFVNAFGFHGFIIVNNYVVHVLASKQYWTDGYSIFIFPNGENRFPSSKTDKRASVASSRARLHPHRRRRRCHRRRRLGPAGPRHCRPRCPARDPTHPVRSCPSSVRRSHAHRCRPKRNPLSSLAFSQ